MCPEKTLNCLPKYGLPIHYNNNNNNNRLYFLRIIHVNHKAYFI